jgi:hypothetical protein
MTSNISPAFRERVRNAIMRCVINGQHFQAQVMKRTLLSEAAVLDKLDVTERKRLENATAIDGMSALRVADFRKGFTGGDLAFLANMSLKLLCQGDYLSVGVINRFLSSDSSRVDANVHLPLQADQKEDIERIDSRAFCLGLLGRR